MVTVCNLNVCKDIHTTQSHSTTNISHYSVSTIETGQAKAEENRPFLHLQPFTSQRAERSDAKSKEDARTLGRYSIILLRAAFQHECGSRVVVGNQPLCGG